MSFAYVRLSYASMRRALLNYTRFQAESSRYAPTPQSATFAVQLYDDYVQAMAAFISAVATYLDLARLEPDQ